ncbi:hypothetical protein HDK77DRAFT_322175 [Phyllosticta capitalensis]
MTMASGENWDPKEFLLGRFSRTIDPKDLDRRLQRTTTPRHASPENIRSPTSCDQATPPWSLYDSVRDFQHIVACEERSRKALEDHGCPPCCPDDINYPYEDNLGDFEAIVKYWKSKGHQEVMWMQLEDWKAFCRWRKNRRPQRFRAPAFDAYLDELRQRRKKFGLDGEVGLKREIKEQNPLENWVEFQDYHHQIHADIENDIGHQDAIEGHKVLLQWIEEQRKTLAQEFDPKEISKAYGRMLARIELPLDLGLLDKKLEQARTPRYVSPENFRTPTPSDQATPLFVEGLSTLPRNSDIEQEQRKELEDQGCPPCVPTTIQHPYEDGLGNYGGIVRWWKSVGERLILWSQLQDWQEFCEWRQKWRPQSLPEFQDYLDRFRERRNTFGLQGEANLEVQIKDQTRLQNWIEFQDYHHQMHANTEETEENQDHQDYHEILLQWIEEQRKIMVAEEAASESATRPIAPLRKGEKSFRKGPRRKLSSTAESPSKKRRSESPVEEEVDEETEARPRKSRRTNNASSKTAANDARRVQHERPDETRTTVPRRRATRRGQEYAVAQDEAATTAAPRRSTRQRQQTTTKPAQESTQAKTMKKAEKKAEKKASASVKPATTRSKRTTTTTSSAGRNPQPKNKKTTSKAAETNTAAKDGDAAKSKSKSQSNKPVPAPAQQQPANTRRSTRTRTQTRARGAY